MKLPLDRIGLFFGPVVLIAWLLFVPQGDLSVEAHRLSGILILTILWWILEPIPIPATGLTAVVLCVALGAVPPDARGHLDPARTVLLPFAEPSVFFLLGGLFIGRAMSRHGLDRRLALLLLSTRWAGRSPVTILCAIGVSVSVISMWISNTAATAIMYPITMGIVSVLATGSGLNYDTFARSPYASALLLMTAYASCVGGVSTPIGTATNVVAIGAFRQPEYFGQRVDFLRWTMVGLPMMAFVLVGLCAWLRWRMGRVMNDLDMVRLRAYLQEESAQLGPWKPGERNTLAVFLILLTLWCSPTVLTLLDEPEWAEAFSKRFPEEITALLAPVLLFLLPCNWRERKATLEGADLLAVDWGTILLFGSGLAMGSLMFKTGLARVVGQGVFEALGSQDVWLLTAVAIAGGIVLSEFTGNAATAATLLPVTLAICREAGVEAQPPLLGVAFGASFGSALPVSTPPNAIVYSSGLVPVRRMILAGLGLDILAGVAIWVVLRLAFALHWTLFSGPNT